MNESELNLVHAARNGEIEAWRSLLDVHAPRLAAYIGARLRRPEIVDKLVADTIYVAWKRLPDLEDASTFASWFRKLGGSVTMRWYKRHHDEGISGAFPVERVPSEFAAPALAALDKAMGELPEKERMALEQRFRAGLEGEELAEVLHIKKADAERLLDKALQHLHETQLKNS